MSQFTEFAASLTARQVEYVKQSQEVVLAGLRKVIENAPEAPEAVKTFASDVASRQAEFVSQGQDAVFAAVSSAIEALPEVPEVTLPEQVAETIKPAVGFIGTPAELKDVFVSTSKTWVAVTKDFSDKLVAEFVKAA